MSGSIRRHHFLHEQAYQVLRSKILNGTLSPGSRLVETQLALELRVSRTPLREALRKLQKDKLVVAEPSGGLRVTTLSTQDAEELYDCRIALESLAVGAVCARATPEILANIHCRLQAEEETSPSEPLDPVKLLDVDHQFHRAIALGAGNQYLLDLLEQVFNAMALLRLQILQQLPYVMDIHLEHQEIWQAIAARDQQRASAAMTAHLRASRERVVAQIRQLYQDG